MSNASAMASPPLPGLAESPSIAVIIPAFGHPVLLPEAIESVLGQVGSQSIGIVIVSDGCRHPETHGVARAYAVAHRNVVYLRKANGGPSSARNYGIDFALRRWPEVAAFFFLDADNRLTPTALDDAHGALKSAPGIGWIYSHITSFGINWSANHGAPYSPLLHIVHDNICDTGSLVAAEVLRAGVRFDENAKSGYEDWDFWLQCLARGFVGKHAPFGLAYRQRPESRYREMNRQRGAMVEYLRRRHASIAAPGNLLRLEHEGNPRYLYRNADSLLYQAFTDPTAPSLTMARDALAEHFFAALQHPDEVLIPPFVAWGRDGALARLASLRVIHTILALMEREAARASFVVLTWQDVSGEIGLTIGPAAEPASLRERGVIWMCQAKLMREIVLDGGDTWVRSLNSNAPEPVLIELHLRGPLAELPPEEADDMPRPRALAALLDSVADLRSSRFRATPMARWNWRGQQFPSREDYYKAACRYTGVSALPPRLPSGKFEVAFVVPIASYGGAEKVAYAMARFLRDAGASVHLFIVATPTMKIIPEYDGVFETIGFLADPDFPRWGGPLTVFGQECFMPDAPELNGDEVVGRLCAFDMVVNCHSAPLNAMMGALRARKVRTATYLHVFDTTPLRRAAGHPYLALGFEHAYDMVFTCSRQLADDLHALGMPGGKIMAIQNAAGFSIPDSVKAEMRQIRAQPRGGRPLHALYIGRLDRQKGVERLLGIAQRLHASKPLVEIRVIGSGLLEGDNENWAGELSCLDVAVQPPVYASEALAAAYAWADVLLLPSRWEGAPLVIPECHQLGCIPIATNVGAVSELTTTGVDGILVESEGDRETAIAMADAIMVLAFDDKRRVEMALAALDRSDGNQWDHNFAPVLSVLRNFR